MTIFDKNHMKSKNVTPETTTLVDADSLSRVVKMALDSGEVGSVAAGYELFRSYRLSVVVGHELAVSVAHQAALLTIVNTARRALLGGVVVAGNLDVPLLAPIPGCATLAETVGHLGGQAVREALNDAPILTLGHVGAIIQHHPVSLAVTFEDWRGGVIPTAEGRRLPEERAITPAAFLAGPLGGSLVFQFLPRNPFAGPLSLSP